MALDNIATARQEIAKIYIAAFNRVPDSAGLDNWYNQYAAGLMTYAQISQDFSNQAEYKITYPAYLTSTEYITKIYTNVFGRTPDAGGLQNWINQIDNSTVSGIDRTTVMKSMLDSATSNAANNDGLRLTNQANFAVQSVVDGVATATATAQLANITFDAATIATATTAVASSAGLTGATYTLTLSAVTGLFDNMTGTSGNDTFYAVSNGALVTGDIVNGAGGTDILNSRHTITAATTIAPTVSDVETHTVQLDHDGGAADVVTYDMSAITGATKVVMHHAVNSGAVGDAVLTLSGTGMTTAVTVGIQGGDTGANNSSIDLTAVYQAVTGTADASTLELNGAAANVVTIAGIEALTISALATDTSLSATGASTLNSLQAANASTVTVTGAGVANLSGAVGATTQVAANFAAVVTVNASANTGGVTMLSETNTLTFTGGTGNDSVHMAGTLTSVDTLVGGDGTDTLGLTAAVTSANGVGVSGFELLDISGAGGVTIDMANFANNTFTGITLLEESASEIVNNVTSGSTFTIGGGATAITATSDLTVGVKSAGVAGHNTDSLNVAIIGTAAVDFGTLVVASTESLTIASGGALTSNSIAIFTAAAATNLTLTGASELTISAFTSSSALTSIDASAMTGAFIMGAAGVATAATSIKGGSGADTLRGNAGDDVITGGDGIDTIYGGAGDDDITGGDGADVIVILPGATNTATSTASTANALTATIAQGDTITFGNGVDIIRGFVSGTDDLKVSDATVAFEATAPTTLIGATAGDIAENAIHGARGNYVESTGVFTLSATGTDYMIAVNDGTAADDVLSTNTNITVLIGVTALVAGDFI